MVTDTVALESAHQSWTVPGNSASLLARPIPRLLKVFA